MLDDRTLALLGDKAAQERITERGELLPCPFCKSENIKFHFANGEYWIECAECGAGCGFENGLGKAVRIWNNRALILTETQLALLKIAQKPRKFRRETK